MPTPKTLLTPRPLLRTHWSLPLRPAPAHLRGALHRAILRQPGTRKLRLKGFMAGLAAVWFVLFLVLAVQASTITVNIRNTSGNAYATNALFTPLSTPQADGSAIIATTPTNVIAAADGSFSVTLKQGNYKVNIGNV